MHSKLLALTRDTRLALLLTVLSGFLAGLLTIGQAYLISSTVNGVFLEGKTLAEVFNWLKWILLIIAGRAALTCINEVSANAVAVKIKTDLRERLFNHILKLGPAYTRTQRTGELTTAAVEGIEALDAYYSQYLPQLVITALVPLSILLFVFPVDLLSGLILLITAPLIPFFMVLIGKGAEIVTKRQYQTLSRLSAYFLDSLQGLTTLKLFGQSKAHAGNIEKISNQFRDVTLGVLRVTFLSALALELLATLSTAIIAVEIGFRLLYAKMEFREAFFLLILAPEFYMPLRMLGARFHAGMSGTTAAKKIFEILDTPVPRRDDFPDTARRGQDTLAPGVICLANHAGGCTRPKTTEGATAPESIIFNNVSFIYPDEATLVLEKINLQIQAGQHIALVGKTGSGKSTLVNLLLGFIQPTSGRISLTHDSQITNYQLRNSIAWVPQKPHLFHDTISANIRLGKPAATNKEIIEAARAAHLHEFIETLPDKYETVIGESGARLSGGQAQRLALARAFLQDAPILILDEPTSSLDPETEALLEESTRRLMQGRTIVTIAHRLNTIFRSDQIIVLEKGRIVEQGTHRELLNKNGTYAAMIKAVEMNVENVEGLKPTVRPDLQPSTFGVQRFNHSPSSIVHTCTGRTLPGTVPDLSLWDKSGRCAPDVIFEMLEHFMANHAGECRGRQSPILLHLLSFLNGSWIWVALSILFSTFTIGASVALIGTSSWLIATAALHPSVADLGVSVVGVRFFGISRGVFRYLERLVSHSVTFRLLARLRVWFYEKLEPLAPARLMEYKSGDLLARVVGDVETLENFYVRVISPALTAILIGLSVSAFFASFYPLLALVLISFFLILGLILPLLSQILSRAPGQRLIAQRADLQSQLVDGIQGLADLLAFGCGEERARQISKLGESYGATQKQMARISGVQFALVTLLTNLGLWLMLLLVIPQVTAGNIKGVMLGTFALMTFASFEAVTPLPLAAQLWNSAREAARRLFEVVDVQPALKEIEDQRKEIPSSAGLQFSHLTFYYPDQTSPALRDISFTLEAGKSMAVVGPSGAGKSTIANLLFRFWDYETGEICLGGEPLKSLNQDEVRKRFALISQNSYFFNTSIRENLRLARRSMSPTEMEAAVRAAQIHEFVMNLPKGYDTFIGEQGLRLSGGERQRLAISRALLKDAPILICDEPTANLDPLTEKQVLATLFEVMKRKTFILITHRLIGLENVDTILVMDNGLIVERGSHHELIAHNGLYRRMWGLQNQILTETEDANI